MLGCWECRAVSPVSPIALRLRNVGRGDIPVHEVAVNLPFSARLALPDYDPLARIQNTAVRCSRRKLTCIECQFSTLLYFPNDRAKRIPISSHNLFPSLMD